LPKKVRAVSVFASALEQDYDAVRSGNPGQPSQVLNARREVEMLGPTLHGELISLEPARPEDAPLRQRWFSDLEVTRLYTGPGVQSFRQEEESFEKTARDDSVMLWRIDLDGVSIGQAFLYDLNWTDRQAHTGMWIGERSQWGKGYGTEVVRLRTAFVFEGLGLERIETSSMDVNIGMHRVLERSGFRRIGTRAHRFWRGSGWHDEYIFELLRHEWLERATAG
jgi:RimJ/RimL family protein N-acetyltransferase